MEERYEILSKIGQGGLGAVYQAFDNRMNREVAIKRISTGDSDPETQSESTRQLIKEAGALASFQHPNIVTIHDVGSDEDGPYVVMELISGKTLDASIEQAPLTWPDFRELALQTQEALIAAQERNLVHSDIKPSNLMVTWLPSGKFQIKIVDFGLATLAQSQSKQDLESIEAVFGSIYFMPPEQFERCPLDMRSDMYSMGCVYYQALTGIYPFDGKTGHEVMTSHLHHAVKPIHEVRAGIPMWACEWVMWHINRFPEDRPESARDALSVFLKNDRSSHSTVSLGFAKPAAGPPRPRLVVPGSGPPKEAAPAVAQPNPSPADGGASRPAPQALAPPEGFKPSVHTSLHDTRDPLPDPPAAPTGRLTASASITQRGTPAAPPAAPKPAPMAKKTKLIIASVVSVIMLISSMFLLKFVREKQRIQVIADILALAEKPGTTEIKINKADLRSLLKEASTADSSIKLQEVSKALSLAQSTDGTDIDSQIADLAINHPELPQRTREMLLRDVLRLRNNPKVHPALMKFVASSDDPTLVVAALQAIRNSSGDETFDALLKMIQSTTDNQIRDAVEENIVAIIRKSAKVDELRKQIELAHQSNVKPDLQRALQRLLSLCNSVKPG
jgi:serine/threonine protein kinase